MQELGKLLHRLHLGCGGNILPQWENHDSEIDICKPLPFASNSIDAIFIEHCVEHVTSPDAMRFMEECYRVLKPDGVLRVSVPSATRIYASNNEKYAKFCYEKGFARAATTVEATRAIICGHGHLSVWTKDLLAVFFSVAGFRFVSPVDCRESRYEVMRTAGAESPNSHWRVIGEEFNDLETITCEGVK